MPTYGYECTACNHQFEVLQKVTDGPIKTCELCGKPVRKLIFPVGIVFKGSGFHINDYSRKSSENGNGKKPSEDPAPKDTKKAESTSDKP